MTICHNQKERLLQNLLLYLPRQIIVNYTDYLYLMILKKERNNYNNNNIKNGKVFALSLHYYVEKLQNIFSQ